MESRRARTPAPKPCISCTVRMPREAPAPSPSLRPGALPAEGSCFLRRPAAPSPRRLAPHPAAGSQSQSRHPHRGRRKCEAPSRARALPQGPAALPSRGSRTGASRPRAPLVKGNLAAPSARGDRRWRGGWRGGHGGRRKRSEAWSRRAGTREQRHSLGNPGSQRPWGRGPDTRPASAGRARREGQERHRASQPPGLGLQAGLARTSRPESRGRLSAADKQSSKDTSGGSGGGRGGGGETAAPSPAPAGGEETGARTRGDTQSAAGRSLWAPKVLGSPRLEVTAPGRGRGPAPGAGAGDRCPGGAGAGLALPHLLLRPGELLLHVAGDLPRRHPLAAHLSHCGSGSPGGGADLPARSPGPGLPRRAAH